MLRHAELSDIPALVSLEERCFATDRISRRSFRYLLSKAHAATLVHTEGGELCGYALVLFSRGTALARLYSIAVEPELRGRGIGRRLLEAAENEARQQGCVSMRLEVRSDNQPTIALYRKAGYRQIDIIPDYYEDHQEALRFERTLAPQLSLALARVPYYEQTLDFTCGPACLMMAMKALDPELRLDRRLELRLWREATTIFMTSGHGGCGPYGLALSAYHRGFDVEVYVNRDLGPFLVSSVRSPEKKEVMQLVEEDLLEELRALPIELHEDVLSVDGLRERFERGGIPIVLISSYRIYEERSPHWVVVTGFDERFIYAHDPYIDYEEGETIADSLNMPIARKEFERMARYGRAGQKAVVIVSARGGRAGPGGWTGLAVEERG